MISYRSKPLEERANFAKSVLKKYAGRFPLIVESTNKDLPPVHKFIIPDDLTVGNLLIVLRKRIKLEPSEAIYIFFKNNIVNSSTLLTDVYTKYKDDDGILYANYSKENTFG